MAGRELPTNLGSRVAEPAVVETDRHAWPGRYTPPLRKAAAGGWRTLGRGGCWARRGYGGRAGGAGGVAAARRGTVITAPTRRGRRRLGACPRYPHPLNAPSAAPAAGVVVCVRA